jgi:hypothetical protein
VLPYELLRSTPAAFVTRVVEFCGATASAAAIAHLPYGNDVHPSLGALGTRWKRRANRYIARTDRLNPEPWLRVTKRGHYTLYEAIRRLERATPGALRRRAEDHTREAIQTWAQHRFRESNSATDEWTEDDLSALGYATL